MPGSLVDLLTRFAAALRDEGVEVGLSDAIDAAEALTLVDLGDRTQVYHALRAALRIRRRDADVFDRLFARFWSATAPRETERRARATQDAGLGRVTRFDGTEAGRNQAPPGSAADGERPGYAPDALLRRKAFDELSAAEQAAMDRLMARLALRLATRPSRRLRPARGRGRIDLRRSLRAAVATDSEILRLARRRPRCERSSLVAFCDTSGSMDLHGRFLLSFVLALRRATRGSEIFALNTRLTRLTNTVSAGNLKVTLERLAAEVPDWSGGTRLGDCLAEFVDRYLDSTLTPHSVVLILSDGLDQGATERLTAAMAAIRSRARRVIWLNPLAGDPRYEPEARGMRAALPYVDHLIPAHNLEALEGALPLLAA